MPLTPKVTQVENERSDNLHKSSLLLDALTRKCNWVACIKGMKAFNKLFLIEGKDGLWAKIDTKNTGRSWGIGVGGKMVEVIEYLLECAIAFSK